MQVLLRTWWSAWTVGTAIGGFLALTGASTNLWMTVAAMGAFVGAWGRWVLAQGRAAVAPSLQASAARAVAGAGSAVAWLGWYSSSAGAGLLYALICVVGVALLTEADVPSRRADDRGRRPNPGRADLDQDALRLVVRSRSFDQVCWAWQVTRYRTVDPDPQRRVEAALQREILLDEIERRDRAAFSSWLSADPVADGRPGQRPGSPGSNAA